MSTRSDQRKDAAEHGLTILLMSMTLAVSVSSPALKGRPATKS